MLVSVLFILFLVFIMPNMASRTDTESTMNRSPDLSLVYTPEDLYQMAEGYGGEGRAEYIKMRVTFDRGWPLVYMVFLTAAISWLYRRTFNPGSAWQLANLAPVLGALFDYLENIGASIVMARYPETTPVIDLATPLMTLIKWLFVGGSFVLLVIGLILMFIILTRANQLGAA